MIRPLLFCLLVGSSVSAFAQDSAPSESTVLILEQAVSIAHANNRSVKNAQLVASIDEDQIAEARTYRLLACAMLTACSDRKSTPLNSSHPNISYSVFFF